MGNLIDGRTADRAADKKFVYLKLGLGKFWVVLLEGKVIDRFFSSGKLNWRHRLKKAKQILSLCYQIEHWLIVKAMFCKWSGCTWQFDSAWLRRILQRGPPHPPRSTLLPLIILCEFPLSHPESANSIINIRAAISLVWKFTVDLLDSAALGKRALPFLPLGDGTAHTVDCFQDCSLQETPFRSQHEAQPSNRCISLCYCVWGCSEY